MTSSEVKSVTNVTVLNVIKQLITELQGEHIGDELKQEYDWMMMHADKAIEIESRDFTVFDLECDK